MTEAGKVTTDCEVTGNALVAQMASDSHYNPDSIQLLLSDDGQGFDTQKKLHGMGLRSIRDRVSSVHGTVQIQSAPGQGTRIIVQVPTKN